MGKIIKGLLKRVRVLSLAVLVADILGLVCLALREVYFVFDVVSNFALVAFLISVLNLPILILCFRTKIIFVLQLLLLVIIGFYVNEYNYRTDHSEVKGRGELKISCHNVLSSNSSKDPFLGDILKEESDILGLLEVTDEWLLFLAGSEEFRKLYPYRKEWSRGDNFGIALYSRIPLNMEVKHSQEASIPWILADASDSVWQFSLALVHTLPPVSPEYHKVALLQSEEVLSYMDHKNSIVMGDFNATPNASLFRHIVASGRLRPCGPALQTTWGSSKMPFGFLQLDHIFIGEDIPVVTSATGPYNGSDHRRISVIIESSISQF